MAKPRELYSGPAPQAMSQMGQGIADAYANAGRIEGQGMAALGQGIAQGIGAVAGAVADYKKMSSQVKSSENFYKTMRDYLPPEMTKGIDTVVGGEVYKNMGTAEKAQLWGDVRAYNVAALGQYHKMQQTEAEQAGAMNRALVGVGPQYAQLEEQRKQRENEQKRYDATNTKINLFKESINALRGSF
jgi:hypothetical protein